MISFFYKSQNNIKHIIINIKKINLQVTFTFKSHWKVNRKSWGVSATMTATVIAFQDLRFYFVDYDNVFLQFIRSFILFFYVTCDHGLPLL